MTAVEPRAVAVPAGLDHWSLHKGLDKYELLAQIRPTDAYDGILLHRVGLNVADLLTSVVTYDGRVAADKVSLTIVWLRSEWRRLSDGSLSITKASVSTGEPADDVMVVASVPLVVSGGAA